MKRAFAFICIGVIVVLSLTLATYIVLTRFSAEDEVRRMLSAMSQVETVREEAGLSWTRGEDDRVTTTLFTSGQINLADPSAVEHGTEFRVVRIGRGHDYEDLSGEIRSVDGTTYLTYAPPGPEIVGMDFDSRNTWVSFEQGELPRWGEIIPGLDLPFLAVEDATHQSWTPEGVDRLRQLLGRADVFVVSFEGLTELIDGQTTRILDAQLDPVALRAFLRDLVRAREGREPTDAERLDVEEQAASLERLTVRMWVGSRDHRLYRLQAAGGVTQAESTDLVPVDVRIEFSDFDEPFEVTAPQRTVEFSDLLAQTLANLPESASASLGTASDTFLNDQSAQLPVIRVVESADPDQDGLDNLLEAFYGTDNQNPDTDGDGALDGDEVRDGKNPRGTGSLFGFGLD